MLSYTHIFFCLFPFCLYYTCGDNKNYEIRTFPAHPNCTVGSAYGLAFSISHGLVPFSLRGSAAVSFFDLGTCGGIGIDATWMDPWWHRKTIQVSVLSWRDYVRVMSERNSDGVYGLCELEGGGGVKHTDWYWLSIFQRSELERNLNDAEVALKRNRDDKSNRKCNEHEVTTNWSATRTHMVPTLSDPPIYVYRPINEMWLDQLWQRLKNGEVKHRSVNTNVVRSALITRCRNRPNHILLIGRIVISKIPGIFHVHCMFCLFIFNCLIRFLKQLFGDERILLLLTKSKSFNMSRLVIRFEKRATKSPAARLVSVRVHNTFN